jgi:hypothetical protein
MNRKINAQFNPFLKSKIIFVGKNERECFLKINTLTKTTVIFYADGYRLAQTAIQQGFSKDTMFKAIEYLYNAFDGLNDSIIAFDNTKNNNVACYNGCH